MGGCVSAPRPDKKLNSVAPDPSPSKVRSFVSSFGHFVGLRSEKPSIEKNGTKKASKVKKWDSILAASVHNFFGSWVAWLLGL